MKVQSKYPLLFTLIEKDYLSHYYEDERTSGDVYKALYLQGEQIQDDRVVHWKPLSADPDVNEQGLGWKDAHACWIRRDQQSFLVSPGSLPQAEEFPLGLISASGRYQWSVERTPEQETRLQQLDRQTGLTSVLGQYPKSTHLDLASDPSSDRLVWSGPGMAPLSCWEPELQSYTLLNPGLTGDISQPVFSPDGKTWPSCWTSRSTISATGAPTRSAARVATATTTANNRAGPPTAGDSSMSTRITTSTTTR